VWFNDGMTRRRIKSIESHIAHDDYFGTLATTLDLLRQDMAKSGGKRANRALLGRLRDDLLYLQDGPCLYNASKRYDASD
jgi:hypothetical protein